MDYGLKRLQNHNIDISLNQYLITHTINKEHITLKDSINFKRNISKLLKNYPVQYLVGNVNFYGYIYKVNHNVLIPRFETEELVSNTITYIKKYFHEPINIGDLGTGSGCIAITIKKELPLCHVFASDISSKALKVAHNNSDEHKADITFLKGNMLLPFINQKIKLDILISNPPYIKDDEPIMDVVKLYEPHQALYGGADGLNYYRQIIDNAQNIMNDRFLIALEIGCTLGENIMALAHQAFPDAKIILKKDLALKDRFIFILNNIE